MPMINLNSPDVREALKDVEKMNTRYQWATLEILEFKHENVIRLNYGTIHTNGMHERAIGTMNYSMRDGKVIVVRSAHA